MPLSTPKLDAGKAFPPFSCPTLNHGEFSLQDHAGHWVLLIVYRGAHCGRCKTYLSTLESVQQQWHDAGFRILAVSADPEDRARKDATDNQWTFPVGFDLNQSQMEAMGLYMSDPLSTGETDRRFAEPGVFCIRPDGTIQIVAISNGPSARPDLPSLLDGMVFTIENDKPARGTATA